MSISCLLSSGLQVKQEPFGKRNLQPVLSSTLAGPRIGREESGPGPSAQGKHPDISFNAQEIRKLDDELSEWKKGRRRNYRLPWRQISLMASVSFGIAYFVLPDSVNQSVQWLLLALAILSFISTFSRRLTQLEQNRSEIVDQFVAAGAMDQWLKPMRSVVLGV